MTKRISLVNRIGAATVVALFLLMHRSNVFAQTTTEGVIERITSRGIALTSGQAYVKSDDATVMLSKDQLGGWQDLQPGDEVRLTFNTKRQIVAVNMVVKLIAQRSEQPLVGFNDREDPVWLINPIAAGTAEPKKEVVIGGRVFKTAFGINSNDPRVVFSNREGYDTLDVWIGEVIAAKEAVYQVLGDGEVLYRSPKMTPQSQAIHISLPIKGYTGITMEMNAKGNFFAALSLWGDPTFIKLPSTIPNVISPRVNERVIGNTPFVWKPVEGATGYLVEMQAMSLENLEDENDENRFLIFRLPPETTIYNFDANKMPKGKWRWRVHALNKTGILGEMEDWRFFSTQ